ncbi:MAG TPA: D-arabinono-1,4-lactone oxidase, partial [Herpetosiphonaceae bacterium]
PSINATGFVAAGCHGTGWNQPTVSDLIYAVEIVGSDGQVHVFSEETTPSDMNTVRVSLGTLGIISKVTLKVEPMYRLRDQELIVPTADVMGPNPATSGGKVDASRLSDRVTGNQYVELFWFPWSGGSAFSNQLDDGLIWVKQFNRTEDDPRDVPLRPPDWQAQFAETLMEQVAEHPTNALVVPPIELAVWYALRQQIADIEQTDGFIADAPRVLHYQEQAFPILDLEIAIPIPATGTNSWDFTNIVTAWYQVVNHVRARAAESVYPLTCCLHARFTSNSQALLSPAYQPAGSKTHYCWLEILSAYPKREPNPNNRKADMAPYDELASIIGPTWIKKMNGRPHWAKYWQNIPGIDIAALYPQANRDQFNALRRRLDPNGMFINPFLKGLNLFR